VAVTVTENWHWLLAAIVAPDRAMVPEAAVVVTVPPQMVAVASATVKPAGNVSLNATPFSAPGLPAGLVMVKVSDVVAFTGMPAGLKALAITGGVNTFTLAEAVPPVPPSTDVTFPVVLFLSPDVVPVTFTVNVQELLAAMLPPERLMVPEPAVAVMVPPPPQEPLKPLGVETTKPAGSVSLKATPVRAVVVLLFWMVNCNDVLALGAMLAAPKALMITGGATTVMEAVDGVLVPPSFELTSTVLFFTVAVVPWTST